jgi:glycosyltransferase involved in cell wall biosynthesis
MRILVFNWRDIRNPNSGGAEILTHEMAKRWVTLGHTVVQFSSDFTGARKNEIIDGVNYVRGGSERIFSLKTPVHIKAMLWYLRHGKGKFDVVLDEIHGIPFFTPLYVKEKKIVLICEIAGTIWDVLFPFPLNLFGRFVEQNYFRFYSKIRFLTISNSTKDELMKKGVLENNIAVLPMGITIPQNLKSYQKEKNPTIIFVGRLSITKGVRDAILAFKEINNKLPKSKLWIVGRGENSYENELKKLVREKALNDSVVFHGYVSQKRKYELMSRAHILLAPSQKEGWGLIVPEAGLFKTPSVAYDVEGLRDIIRDGESGFLVVGIEGLVDKTMKLLRRQDLYSKIQKNAYLFAKQQDWDSASRVSLEALAG